MCNWINFEEIYITMKIQNLPTTVKGSQGPLWSTLRLPTGQATTQMLPAV